MGTLVRALVWFLPKLMNSFVVAGYVYAVGGKDGDSDLSSVERYNHVDDIWTTVAEMFCRRIGPGE